MTSDLKLKRTQLSILSDREKQTVIDTLDHYRLTSSDITDYMVGGYTVPCARYYLDDFDSDLDCPPMKILTVIDGRVCKLETVTLDENGNELSTTVDIDRTEEVEDEIRDVRA